MKNSIKWLAMSIIPVLAACNNQGNQIDNELAAPVSVADVVKKPIVQYINTTGTASAASQVVLTSEMTGDYHLARKPKNGYDIQTWRHGRKRTGNCST